ncbi:MAG: hypothetical protein P8074_10240 [Anaerolineales bacterium]
MRARERTPHRGVSTGRNFGWPRMGTYAPPGRFYRSHIGRPRMGTYAPPVCFYTEGFQLTG